MAWEATVDQTKDREKDMVLKCRGESFILGELHILPFYLVTALLQVGNYQIAVLVVKTNSTGSRLVLKVQEVKEVDSLVLDVVVFSKLIVDGLQAGGVTHDDIVVVDIARLGYDAEKSSQLCAPNWQVCCGIWCHWLCDVTVISICCEPGGVVSTLHEGCKPLILAQVDFQLLSPYIEQEVCNILFW